MNEDNEVSTDDKKKGQKKAKKSNKSKAAQRKNSKKSSEQQTGNDLSAKIFATMEKHKEVFFVIRLHSAQSAASLAVSDFAYIFWQPFASILDNSFILIVHCFYCSFLHSAITSNSLFKIQIRS